MNVECLKVVSCCAWYSIIDNTLLPPRKRYIGNIHQQSTKAPIHAFPRRENVSFDYLCKIMLQSRLYGAIMFHVKSCHCRPWDEIWLKFKVLRLFSRCILRWPSGIRHDITLRWQQTVKLVCLFSNWINIVSLFWGYTQLSFTRSFKNAPRTPGL